MENKLIQMTSFVTDQPTTYEWGAIIPQYRLYQNILKYAQFLKQPLALWMFVPCDENNVPLEFIEYETWTGSDEEYNKYTHKYFEAKERVLFGGFELLSDYNGMYRLRNAENVDITFNKYGCYAEPFGSIPGKRINTIEEITYLDLTLTETNKIKSDYLNGMAIQHAKDHLVYEHIKKHLNEYLSNGK